MATERVYHCDGPGCETHAKTAAKGRAAMGFLTVSGDGPPNHFCGWDCVMKFAAQFDPPEIIHLDGGLDDVR